MKKRKKEKVLWQTVDQIVAFYQEDESHLATATAAFFYSHCHQLEMPFDFELLIERTKRATFVDANNVICWRVVSMV